MTEPNSNILPTDPLDTRSIGFSFCFIFFLFFFDKYGIGIGCLGCWQSTEGAKLQSHSHQKIENCEVPFPAKKMLKMATGVPARLCPARCSVGFGRAGATGGRAETDERHMVTL